MNNDQVSRFRYKMYLYYIVKYTTSKSPRSDYPKSYRDQITVFKLFYTCLIIRYYSNVIDCVFNSRHAGLLLFKTIPIYLIIKLCVQVNAMPTIIGDRNYRCFIVFSSYYKLCIFYFYYYLCTLNVFTLILCLMVFFYFLNSEQLLRKVQV